MWTNVFNITVLYYFSIIFLYFLEIFYRAVIYTISYSNLIDISETVQGTHRLHSAFRFHFRENNRCNLLALSSGFYWEYMQNHGTKARIERKFSQHFPTGDTVTSFSKSNLVSDTIDNLRRVFQAINEYSRKAERDTGLTGPQLWAIKVIASDAPIKVSELARRIYLHPTTVVGILDRLEAKKLVERTRSREDRRVVEIKLTAQGEELVAKAPEVAQGLLVKGLESLPDAELVNTGEALKKLVAMLGAEELPPRLLLSTEVNIPRE